MVIDLNPVILHLGPLEVRWYGLMYVISFIIGGEIVKRLIKQGFFHLPLEKLDLFIFHLIIGMFLGARSFYVLIYNWDIYAGDWLEMIAVWHGGLSFHGGLVGFIVVTLLYSRKLKCSLFHVGDTLALAASQGLFWGRIGNFINGELYGRVTDVPWAMIFPAGGPFPRHPSQLYESLTEGLLLTIILWVAKRYVKTHGIIASLFIIGYGVFRFIVEFFREPDVQLGKYFGDIFSMGQILCFIMILFGLTLAYWCYRHREHVLYQIRLIPPKETEKSK